MCYNPEVSIGTFLFVSICCAYMWMRNHKLDRGLVIMFMAIVLMQLLEFFMWFEVDTCSDTNLFLSQLVPYALWIQPILFLFAAWQFNIGWAVGYRELFFLCVALVPLLMWYQTLMKPECVITGKNGHLIWSGTMENIVNTTETIPLLIHILYIIVTNYVIFTIRNIPLALLLGLTSMFFCLHAYYQSKEEWPSVYCHTINALVIFAILLN